MKRYSFDGARPFPDQSWGAWVYFEDAQAELSQLRGNLSLAEEGLANAMQELENAKHDIDRLMTAATAEANEVERLRAVADQLEASKARYWTHYNDGFNCGLQKAIDLIRGAEPQPGEQP